MSLLALVNGPAEIARAARVLARETVDGASKHAALLIFCDPVTFATAVVMSMVARARGRD